MEKVTVLSNDILKAIDNSTNFRVIELAKELSTYGLAVAMPHIHEGEVVATLPSDKVQYEKDLSVSFPNKVEFEANNKKGFPVMWRYNNKTGNVEACAWCHDE